MSGSSGGGIISCNCSFSISANQQSVFLHEIRRYIRDFTIAWRIVLSCENPCCVESWTVVITTCIARKVRTVNLVNMQDCIPSTC